MVSLPLCRCRAKSTQSLLERGPVAEALLVDPLHEPAEQRADHRAERDGDDHVAVEARVDGPQQQGTEAHATGLALHGLQPGGGVQDGAECRLTHALLRREVDVLAEAGPGAVLQRDERGDGGLRRRRAATPGGCSSAPAAGRVSPVTASWPLDANSVRSVARQPAFGPVSPQGVMCTVTRPASVSRSAARSTGKGRLSSWSTTSAPAARAATSSAEAATTDRFPRL